MSGKEPRLTYFFGYGLAEQARWLLAATVGKEDGSGWTFRGLHKHEEFLDLCQDGSLLFNQLPLLEIDGLKIVQSQAMVRYLARRGGLAGKTDEEMVMADMICETVRDCRGFVTGWPWAKDKEATRKDAATKVHKVFPVFESLVKDNGFFLKSGLSYADVIFAELFHEFLGNLLPAETFDAYPRCVKLYESVVALPQMKGFLQSDKRFPFPEGEAGEAYVKNVAEVLGR